MNREQAKIIGQMSDEQIKTVSELVGCEFQRWISEIRAYGNGATIEEQSDCDWYTSDAPRFNSSYSYRIAPSKIVFNGVEIDAPIKDKDEAPEIVFGIVADYDGYNYYTYTSKEVWRERFSTGLIFSNCEAAQLYCDTHNKMMGVGDD